VRAARLLGAVAAKQDANGFTAVLSDWEVASTVATIQDTLGEEAFTTAWEAGQGMAWADAVADALGVLERERTTPISQPPLRQGGAFALTRREQEILTLLCQRLTNPEIAERLYIGLRTVDTHVANLLVKLGARNRREAAAIAVQRGLA
jgi:DNA-binding CsgD family transcriptional regulator